MYDYSRLSPLDFELLVMDLLKAHLGIDMENFTPGKDSGIDMKFIQNGTVSTIVQCKHYGGSNCNVLKANLRKEREKIQKLNPDRYLLCTSLGLSPMNKKAIAEILSPYLRTSSDMIDKTMLDALLREHEEIEQRHFKLWLTSTAILRRILHSSAVNNSMLTENEIRRQVAVYVHNESFGKALRILTESHYCIISGIPGIGKTTLANLLALNYMNEGYRLVCIDSSIEEAHGELREDEQQFFYFDDFLGTTALSNRNSDKALIRFIEHVHLSKNKRFVLTTREYILNQAQMESELLSRKCLSKCIVRQEDYTKLIRAKILYNHLCFSSVSKGHIRELCETKKYMTIVSHKNYSPRTIQWVTSTAAAKTLETEELSDYLLSLLDNPTLIWQHAFFSHISDRSRTVLVLLSLFGGTMVYEDLRTTLHHWVNSPADSVNEDVALRKAIGELENSFINITAGRDALALSFHDPSVADFLNAYIATNTSVLVPNVWKESHFSDIFDGILSIAMSEEVEAYPGLKRFIGENAEAVLLLMVGSAEKPCGRAFVYSSGYFLRKPATTVGRLNSIFYFFRKIKPGLLQKHSATLLSIAIGMMELMKTATDQTVTLAGHLCEVYPGREELRRVSAIFRKVLEDTNDIEVFSQVSASKTLLDLLGEDSVDLLRGSFSLAVDQMEVDEDKDIDNLETEKAQIEEITEVLGIPLPAYHDKLDARLQQLREKQDDREIDVRESAREEFDSRVLELVREDRIIDEMFQSLCRGTEQMVEVDR